MRKMKSDRDLAKRHQIEKEFHDDWASSIDIEEIKYQKAFTSHTAVENRYILRQMGQLEQKKILDIGCGMGDASLFFASKGSRVEAVDISPGMIQVVKQASKRHKLSRNINATVMAAEKLRFADNQFDIVYGNGLLHHVEPELTLEEVYRVLKPGGIAFFVEPLTHNPLINAYRRIAKHVRTTTEKPFSYEDIEQLTSLSRFAKAHHHEFHFMTLLTFVYFFLIEKTSPNKERYWKKIINEGKRLDKGFSFLLRLDTFLLKKVPYLRRYCWNTVLVFSK